MYSKFQACAHLNVILIKVDKPLKQYFYICT